jgi:hypothetical protein
VNNRLDQFLGLSVALTGFDRLHLLGTGVAAEYMEVLDRVASPPVTDLLLRARERSISEGDKEAEWIQRLLDDALMGPVARNLIILWYTGTWTALPPDWPAPAGRSPLDVGHVVSPEAYLAGLQWATVGAHPAGALPTGFASWSSPPAGVDQ